MLGITSGKGRLKLVRDNNLMSSVYKVTLQCGQSLLLLPGTSLFSDMMFVSTVSRKGKRCAKVYATYFEWARAFPITSRREAHETLLLLFARNDVPPACICNNAKEMIQGMFYKKLKMLHVT